MVKKQIKSKFAHSAKNHGPVAAYWEMQGGKGYVRNMLSSGKIGLGQAEQYCSWGCLAEQRETCSRGCIDSCSGGCADYVQGVVPGSMFCNAEEPAVYTVQS